MTKGPEKRVLSPSYTRVLLGQVIGDMRFMNEGGKYWIETDGVGPEKDIWDRDGKTLPPVPLHTFPIFVRLLSPLSSRVTEKVCILMEGIKSLKFLLPKQDQ